MKICLSHVISDHGIVKYIVTILDSFVPKCSSLVQIPLPEKILWNIVFLIEEFLRNPLPMIDNTVYITPQAIYDKLTELHAQLSTHTEASPRVYDNKSLMSLLGVKDRYLKRLRDNGLLGYSRHGDKYWYTQAEVDRFLTRCHFAPFGRKNGVELC